MDERNWLEQLLVVGIGTTSLVAEKIKEVSDEWVRTGRLDPEQGRKFVDDLMERLRSQPGAQSVGFEEQVQQQLRKVMADLGVPDRAEVEDLRGRVERLERQVRDLENRSWN